MNHSRYAILLAFTVACSVGGNQEPEPLSTEPRILLGPSLTAPSSDGVNVWWHTSLEAEHHRVDYGTSETLGATANLEAPTQYPNVSLNGLSPATTYHYRVVSDPTTSEIYSFRTPAAEGPVKLVLFADNREGFQIFRDYTVSLIAEFAPDALISAGDLVGRGDRYEHWSEHLYRPGRVLWRAIPWFPVRGNHDGEYRLAHDMLPLPNNNQWYARSYGPLRIVVLDSNVDYVAGSPQHEWLRKELAGDAWRLAGFRIVSLHKPPFTALWLGPKYDGEATGRSTLVPLLESNRADLIISGHTHGYEHGERPRSDGGVTHYLVTGGAGGVPDTIRVYPWPHIQISLSRHNIVVLDATRTRLELEAIDPVNGEALDAFTIQSEPAL